MDYEKYKDTTVTKINIVWMFLLLLKRWWN